jgi:hypothetical protein
VASKLKSGEPVATVCSISSTVAPLWHPYVCTRGYPLAKTASPRSPPSENLTGIAPPASVELTVERLSTAA